MYALGIDLGTTYTAAATWRNGHVEIASLGSRAAAVPSVVLRREDDSFLTGEAANRRGLTEPDRVCREFKRRLGDPTPILLGGVPYSAESLMARLLRAVVDDVAEREGGEPTTIAVSHPANWGPYKTDLLRQATRLADLDQPVTLLSEPGAAATFYAHQQRLPAGAVVAVYDLGGGTFDAAVLRKTDSGFVILGQPEGIERLGGIDFDAAVFGHVARALDGALDQLDEDDAQVIAAVARLRAECVEAKEALSSDTDTAVPVLLPQLSTEVRLTRAELEEMVRPALQETVQAMRRALRAAEVTAEELHSVLLVGGSSRMPIVAQLVGAELGRPVAVDAHPKHAIAAGAAWHASGTTLPSPEPAPAAAAIGTATVAPATAVAAPAAASPEPVSALPEPPGRSATPTTPPPASPATPPPASPATSPQAAQAAPPPASPAAAQARGEPAVGTASVPPPSPRRGRSRRWARPAALAAGVAVIAVAGTALAMQASSPEDGAGDPQSAPPTAVLAAEEECTAETRANPRWVCLTSATLDPEGALVVQYEADFGGEIPDKSFGVHLHLYASDGTGPPAETMGNQADEPGAWYIEDAQPAVIPPEQVAAVIGDAPMVCARIADGSHHLVTDLDGGYATGNCTPIAR